MAFSLHLNKKVYMSKWAVNFRSLSKLANDNIDIGIMAQSIPSVNNPRGICHLFFRKNCKCPTVGPLHRPVHIGILQFVSCISLRRVPYLRLLYNVLKSLISRPRVPYFRSPRPVTQHPQVPHLASPRPVFRVPASCYSTSPSPSPRVPESSISRPRDPYFGSSGPRVLLLG